MSAPEVAPVRSTNMRRSIVTMLAALVGLSTPLTGQGGALTVGLAYTVGSGWQVEGLEVGFARAVHAGPIGALSLTARPGSFLAAGASLASPPVFASFATDGGPLPRYRASRYPGHGRSGVGAAGGPRVWGAPAGGGERPAARPQPPPLPPLAPHP